MTTREGRHLTSGLRILYPEQAVREAVNRMAAEIATSSCPQCLHLLGVLEGGRWLVDRLEPALQASGIETQRTLIKVQRCRGDGVLGPPVAEGKADDQIAKLRDRCVLLVDDICDQGKTLALLDERARGVAKQVWSAVVIERLAAEIKGFSPTYAALQTDDQGWLVGCGMDSGGRYRDLPYIGVSTEQDRGGRSI